MHEQFPVWLVSGTFVLVGRSDTPLAFTLELINKMGSLNLSAGPRYIDGQECISILVQIRSPNGVEALDSGLLHLKDIALVFEIELIESSVTFQPFPLKPEVEYIEELLDVIDGQIVPLKLVDHEILDRIDDVLASIVSVHDELQSGLCKWQTPLAKRVFHNLTFCFVRSREYIFFTICSRNKTEILTYHMMTPAVLREVFTNLMQLDQTT